MKMNKPIKLLPREYRLKQAEIAARLYAADIISPNECALNMNKYPEWASGLLASCGIVEADVSADYYQSAVDELCSKIAALQNENQRLTGEYRALQQKFNEIAREVIKP